jgi:hypothetical protein
MALWFASIGIQRAVDQQRNVPRPRHNPFATRGDLRGRVVVNLQDAIEQKLRRQVEVPYATGS